MARRRAIAVSFVAGTISLAGCALIVNDPDVWTGGEDGGGAEGGADATTSDASSSGGHDASAEAALGDGGGTDTGADAGAVCAPGAQMCVGNSVVSCSASQQWDGGVTACFGALCEDGGCVATCTAGQNACADDTTVVACSDAGAFDGGVVPCVASACVGGACTGVCAPGATMCNGTNDVVTCGTSGGWDGGATSCTAAMQACVDGGCTGSCYPGETACLDGSAAFESCNAGGGWDLASCTAPHNGTTACSADAGCSPTGACQNAAYPDYCPVITSCVNFSNDPDNCGFCDHVCENTTACSNGYCAPNALCTTGPNPFSMTLMSGIPFVTNATLYKCLGSNVTTYDGGTVSTSIGSIQANVTNGSVIGLTATVNCHFVCITSYFLTLVTSGGNFINIQPGDDAGTFEGSFAVDPNYGNVFYGYSSGIRFVNASTPNTPTAATPPNFCAPISDGGTPAELSASNNVVAWFDSASNTVSSAAVSGTTCGTPVENAKVTTNVSSLVTDGNYVAWSDGANTIYSCGVNTTCGSSPTVVATGQGQTSNLAFDQASNLYWIGSAGLVKCPATGCSGAPSVLAPPSVVSISDPIGDDGTYVFYTDYNSGTIYRIAN